MAGRYDFIIEQGANFTRVFTYRDSNKALIDLTGYTAAMQIRETVDATAVLATSAGGSPAIVIVLGGALGTITVTITPTITAALSFDNAVYDLELTVGGVVTRLLEGKVTLSKEVTR